ncbi:hypothetical protein ACP4OV_031538 [Aristida adscensionis]
MKHGILSLQVLLLLSSICYSIQTQYTSIFSFGNSYTDTGNLVIVSGGPATPGLVIAKPPYGMTFFGHPTGRLSDGRLAIDFIAEALGLPLLPPSMATNQSFVQGANFAVAGATVLNRTFFVQDGDVAVSPYNISLSYQLGWFDAMKPSLCSSPQACKEYLSKALFVVGELGWNDYGLMLLAGKSIGVVQSHVPEIVGKICAATEKLIGEGARTVVVSGITPLGCAPANQALLANQTGAEREADTGCLRELNLVSKEHNLQLRRALMRLRAGARVIYADMYAPIVDFARSPGRFGFDGADGSGGGPYNFNLSAACGTPGVSACGNVSAYVNWDGVPAHRPRLALGPLRAPAHSRRHR